MRESTADRVGRAGGRCISRVSSVEMRMWRGWRWSPPDGSQLPKFSANDGHPHDDATATLACFPPSSSCSGHGGGCGHNLHENLSHKSNYVPTPLLLLISVGVDSRKWWGAFGLGEIQVAARAEETLGELSHVLLQEENRAKWDGGWDGRSPMRARARRASHNPTPLALMLRVTQT